MRRTIDSYIRHAAALFDVSVADLCGRARYQAACHARFAVCYALRAERTDLSLERIGDALGGRDHATVSNAVQRAAELVATDPDFRQLLDQLLGRDIPPPPPPPRPRILTRDEQIGLYWYQRANYPALVDAA